MAHSPLRLIRQCVEYVPIDQVNKVERGLRGIYVLYRHLRPRAGAKGRYNVVYIGMARQGGIRSRLRKHKRSKADLWTHFSVFEVWPNIRDEEVSELEGLFRHLYRDDAAANALNKQRGFKAMRQLRYKDLEAWPSTVLPTSPRRTV
jgi:hypothetical protein